MKKTPLLVAALVVALGGAAQAQTAQTAQPASTDPVVQMRTESNAVRKTYSDKKKALDSARNAEVKAAGDQAAKEASAKGKDPAVARRDAEAKVKSTTKADYDAKLKALKKERDDGLTAARAKSPPAKS